MSILRACSFAALILLSLRPIALAQTVPISARSEKSGRKVFGAVIVAGATALRLKTPSSGLSATERARLAVRNLRKKLDSGLAPSRVRAMKEDGVWTVSAGVAPIIYVSRREARAHDSDPKSLARAWAARIRGLLAAPAVKLSSRSILVPVGESRSIRVGGWAPSSKRSVTSSAERVASVRLAGHVATVNGLAAGTSRVIVVSGEHRAVCSVIVKKRAGRLNTLIEAEVTGRPAPASLVSEAAALAIRRFIPREQGASVRLVSPPRSRRSLPPGGRSTLTAVVQIAGEGLLPVQGSVNVKVSNAPVPARATSQLMYSNVPEQITKPGTLYFAELSAQVSGRIFYHHINSAKKLATLTVMLVNPEDKPLRLQIVPGFASPHPDPVKAGHRAGKAFLARYLRGIGEIYVLPARTAVPLAVDLLKPNQVGSGMAEVRVLKPESARCYVRVTASYDPPSSLTRAAAATQDSWRRAIPRQATRVETAESTDSADLYPTTLKQINAQYTVGEKWTWIAVGKEPVTDSAGKRRLEGNYGVLYNIDVKVHNPAANARQVEVAFEAGAGPASGVFTIGNQYVEIASIHPREERQLARFTMRPNETRMITIQTVPLGGSAYPAALIVR